MRVGIAGFVSISLGAWICIRGIWASIEKVIRLYNVSIAQKKCFRQAGVLICKVVICTCGLIVGLICLLETIKKVKKEDISHFFNLLVHREKFN